jgi:hypothetical protein
MDIMFIVLMLGFWLAIAGLARGCHRLAAQKAGQS